MPTSPLTPNSNPLLDTLNNHPERPSRKKVMEDYNQRLLKSLEKKATRLRSESNSCTPKKERVRDALSKTTKDRRGHKRNKSSKVATITPDRRALREMYDMFKDKRDEILRKQSLL